MPSLNLDLDYFDHPKTRRLTALLGRGAAELPLRLWCYVGKHHPKNGSLLSYSPKELESLVDWKGKPGAAIDAMLKVGLLDKVKDGFRIHDWDSHAGHLWAYKVRSQKANTVRWQKLQGLTETPTSIQQGSLKESSSCPVLNGPSLNSAPAAAGGERGGKSNGRHAANAAAASAAIERVKRKRLNQQEVSHESRAGR